MVARPEDYISGLNSDNSYRCSKPGEHFLYKLDYSDDLESFSPPVTTYRVAWYTSAYVHGFAVWLEKI